jgi:ketosteroid isomerase-like protein
MSEAKRLLEQAIATWNAGDREGWWALYDEDVEWEAPGGGGISGLEDLKVKYFDALMEAAPDRRLASPWTFRSARSSASTTARLSRSACTTTSSRCAHS